MNKRGPGVFRGAVVGCMAPSQTSRVADVALGADVDAVTAMTLAEVERRENATGQPWEPTVTWLPLGGRAFSDDIFVYGGWWDEFREHHDGFIPAHYGQCWDERDIAQLRRLLRAHPQRQLPDLADRARLADTLPTTRVHHLWVLTSRHDGPHGSWTELESAHASLEGLQDVAERLGEDAGFCALVHIGATASAVDMDRIPAEAKRPAPRSLRACPVEDVDQASWDDLRLDLFLARLNEDLERP